MSALKATCWDAVADDATTANDDDEPNFQPHNLGPHTLTHAAESWLQVLHMVGHLFRFQVFATASAHG